MAHDSHNLIAVGDNDQDILLGIQALEKAGGGYCLARDGKLLEVLPLPVCGLLTQEPTEQVQRALANMKKLCVEMGMPEELDPFQTLSFLSLPVLPEIRITDRASLIPWNTGTCRLVHHRLGLARKKSCRFAWYQFQP
mgnify:CR=1 FL=1